ARALPQVIPGVRFDQSYLGLALRELGHVENLPQRFPVIAAAALIAGGALALGHFIIRVLGLGRALRLGERIPLACGPGTTALGVATLLLGRLGLLAPWPIRVGLGALVVVEGVLQLRDRRERAVEEPTPASSGESINRLGLTALILGAGPFLVLMA